MLLDKVIYISIVRPILPPKRQCFQIDQPTHRTRIALPIVPNKIAKFELLNSRQSLASYGINTGITSSTYYSLENTEEYLQGYIDDPSSRIYHRSNQEPRIAGHSVMGRVYTQKSMRGERLPPLNSRLRTIFISIMEQPLLQRSKFHQDKLS